MAQVLIIRSTQTWTEVVEQQLRQHGHEPILFDTDRFPGEVRVSLLDDGTARIVDGDAVHVLDDLHAIWYRRALYTRPDLPADVAAVVQREARTFVQGLIERFRPYVLQPRSLTTAADLKPRQLSVARRNGLDIPATVVSTDARVLREHARALGGQVVTKVVTPLVVRDDGDAMQVVMTSSVSEEDLESLSEVEVVPVVLQEKLDKQRELRVTVVGEQLFVCSVDTRGDDRASVDWRRNPKGVVWSTDTLPDAVGQALLGTMRDLGLVYGAADIIHTTDGRYVFLEINPAGEYLWVDDLVDRAISRAIADLLHARGGRA